VEAAEGYELHQLGSDSGEEEEDEGDPRHRPGIGYRDTDVDLEDDARNTGNGPGRKLL